MWTVNEVSKRTGVSIRALQYYDKIGLLHPAQYTQAGYRLYDEKGLERLQQILLFRELAFSLKEISCACGFNSVNYFSRRFREHYGYAPSKKQHLGK